MGTHGLSPLTVSFSFDVSFIPAGAIIVQATLQYDFSGGTMGNAVDDGGFADYNGVVSPAGLLMLNAVVGLPGASVPLTAVGSWTYPPPPIQESFGAGPASVAWVLPDEL